MEFLKRASVAIVCFIFFFVCCFFYSGNSEVQPVTTRPAPITKVIIDAGHGGFDGGAVANDGTVEKDLNLKIALKLDAVLRMFGYKTVLTRNTDASLEDENVSGSKKTSDMKKRLSITEQYPKAYFISIHLNKYQTSQPKGTQVFYGLASGSQNLAESIQSAVKNSIQPQNKRVIKKTTNDIFLLCKSKIPSVIVECGFLSNPQELEQLKNEQYQLSLAFAIAEGIILNG